jgi:hypothetical protein
MALAYYKICPFAEHYESAMVYRTGVVRNIFAQMKMTLWKYISFISDISIVRYNIWLTQMGKLATLL